jgi:hypothetical protein
MKSDYISEIQCRRTEEEQGPRVVTRLLFRATPTRKDPDAGTPRITSSGGGQQRFQNVEAESPGGLEVDDEFELARLHDRQIGWFLTFENARGVDAAAAIAISVSV